MANILIVDSDSTRLNQLRYVLKRTGAEVQTEQCAIAALELCRTQVFDVLIVAEILPGIDGMDLLRLMEADPLMAGTPVVVVAETSKRKIECLKAGCAGFLLSTDQEELPFLIPTLLQARTERGLHGDLSHISLLDLIQMFMAARSSGELSVQHGEFSGTMFLREGQVVHAVVGSVQGEEAFLAILRQGQRGGSFSFSSAKTVTVDSTIEKRTDHLLLGLANMLDEEGESTQAP